MLYDGVAYVPEEELQPCSLIYVIVEIDIGYYQAAEVNL
jgi:hypothetical protein